MNSLATWLLGKLYYRIWAIAFDVDVSWRTEQRNTLWQPNVNLAGLTLNNVEIWSPISFVRPKGNATMTLLVRTWITWQMVGYSETNKLGLWRGGEGRGGRERGREGGEGWLLYIFWRDHNIHIAITSCTCASRHSIGSTPNNDT